MKTDEEIKDAIREAQDDFWNSIADSFPDITSGDFDFGESHKFDIACEKAVDHWLNMNN